MDDTLWPLVQAARAIGISRAALHVRIQRNQIAAERIGSQWVIRESVLAPLRGSGRRIPGRKPRVME